MTYTLQDYLLTLHTGQWFGFNGEHTYANLVINSDDTKPTEQECIDGVTALQSIYDNNQYQRDRNYAPIADQLDDIFHNGVKGWKATIQLTKDKYPKGGN